MCPVLLPSELPLSTHLPTSEGWTAESTVGLWLAVPTMGFEPMRVDLIRFETLRLNHSATPSCVLPKTHGCERSGRIGEGFVGASACRRQRTGHA